MTVSLIGYRGTGKTSVGRALSALLKCDHLDSDHEIVRRAKRTIADIFAEDGETAFRDLEEKAIRELTGRDGQNVLSVGGGAILREANREALKSAGAVVWLKAEVASIHQRLSRGASSDTQRPSLTGKGMMEEITEVLHERTPLYAAAATHAIDTTGLRPSQIARQIVELLELDKK